MRQYVRLEIGRLGELLVATVKRTHIRPVAGVDADVRPQIEVERKPFAAAVKRALERLLACVDQLVALQL